MGSGIKEKRIGYRTVIYMGHDANVADVLRFALQTLQLLGSDIQRISVRHEMCWSISCRKIWVGKILGT
jgi:hypothetical protein